MLPDYHLLPHQHLHPPNHHRYIRFSLKHSPSLSPLSYLTLSLVQACSRPHAHHKYKAIHTREGSCRGCQTVTHQPQTPSGGSYTPAAADPGATGQLLHCCRILLQLHTYTHAQTSPKPTHHPDSSSSALNALDDSMHLVCSRIHMQ